MSGRLTQAERAALLDLVARQPLWRPLPGPQTAAYESEADIIGYGGAAGGGKLQSVHSRVLTPTGWKAIGGLRPGSRVCASDGTVTEILGVFPQGVVDLYRVTMSDGGSTLAGLEHNWLAWPTHKTVKKSNAVCHGSGAARKYTTAQMLGELSSGRRADGRKRGFAIPVCAPAAFNVAGGLIGPGRFVARPLDPYLLGLLLGDGSIARRHGLAVTSADEEIAEYLRTIAGEDLRKADREGNAASHYYLRGNTSARVWAALEDLKLAGTHSDTKFIPRQYLFAPTADRWALLQGLMDTDGWVEDRRAVYYCTVSPRLRDDLVHLARSLGAVASVSGKAPTYEYAGSKRDGRPAFAVRMRFPEPVSCFRLSRKRAAAAGIEHQSEGRFIESIEFSHRDEAVCIQVAHPNSLYITDDFIVTHNTDLACGMALTRHHRTMIFRRNGTEIIGIHQRMMQLLGGREGFNGQVDAWTLEVGGQPRLIEYGSTPNAGDETKYQGRPHDLLVFDEAVQFPRHVPMFLRTWNRHEDARQKCQMLFTFNPPTSAEGQWVKEFFGPWLDDKHPRPAAPGELRWYLMLPGGEEREVDGPVTEVIDGIEVRAMSRTFFPAKVTDNPYYMKSGYASVLNSLEEPFRSMMLKGDFSAGMEDDPFAMFPSAWVQLAMDRWREPEKLPTMDSVGADIARGGRDNTVLICRHGQWYSKPIAHKGTTTPDGPTAGALIMAAARDGARLHVDAIGVGSSPVDWLRERDQPVIAVNVAESPTEMSRSGAFGFANLRTQLMWKLREALDPMNNTGICLPPSRELRADMAAVTWEMKGKVIQALSREKIIERLGRSPDYLSALMLASMDSPDMRALEAALRVTRARREHDPMEVFELQPVRQDYNPLNF